MNNLEAIKKAWAMGWSAKLLLDTTTEKSIIISIDNEIEAITIRLENDEIIRRSFDSMTVHEITGYLYGAELCGNEPIPENQTFKEKETGVLYKYNMLHDLDKSEIEPFWS